MKTRKKKISIEFEFMSEHRKSYDWATAAPCIMSTALLPDMTVSMYTLIFFKTIE